MPTSENISNLISESYASRLYSLEDYLLLCSKIRKSIVESEKRNINDKAVKFFEKQFVDEMEPLAKIGLFLKKEMNADCQVQYLGGPNQPNCQPDGKIIFSDAKETFIEITTSVDKKKLNFITYCLRSGVFSIIPFSINMKDVSGGERKGFKYKGVPIEDVFPRKIQEETEIKERKVDRSTVKESLVAIADSIISDYEDKKSHYWNKFRPDDGIKTNKIDDEILVLEIIAPLDLEEIDSIQNRALSDMNLTKEELDFYISNIQAPLKSHPNLNVLGIQVIVPHETEDFIDSLTFDDSIDWNDLKDTEVKVRRRVKTFIAKQSIWNCMSSETVIESLKEQIESAIQKKLDKLLPRRQKVQNKFELTLCITIDDQTFWNEEIKKLMELEFSKICTKYGSELLSIGVKELWFLGYGAISESQNWHSRQKL